MNGGHSSPYNFVPPQSNFHSAGQPNLDTLNIPPYSISYIRSEIAQWKRTNHIQCLAPGAAGRRKLRETPIVLSVHAAASSSTLAGGWTRSTSSPVKMTKQKPSKSQTNGKAAIILLNDEQRSKKMCLIVRGLSTLIKSPTP